MRCLDGINSRSDDDFSVWDSVRFFVNLEKVVSFISMSRLFKIAMIVFALTTSVWMQVGWPLFFAFLSLLALALFHQSVGWKAWVDALIYLINVCGLAVLIKTFYFGIYHVPSSSMYPTILPGDRVLVNKLLPGPRKWSKATQEFVKIHRFQPVQRNGIYVFNSPNEAFSKRGDTLAMKYWTPYVKRCAALPNDVFLLDSLSMTINEHKEVFSCKMPAFTPSFHIPHLGDTLDLDNHPYLEKLMLFQDTLSLVYQSDYFLFVGDNRCHSLDGRHWGPVAEEAIVGKAVCVLFSVHRVSGRLKMRWKRCFKQL